ncbi:TPA: hypothetical protein QFK61_001072 [Enterococcus faecium]
MNENQLRELFKTTESSHTNTYADTYSKAEQMEGWTRFFGWVHENA